MSEASILVIEDEAPIREGLADVLRLQGYEVAVAADGEAGRAAALAGGHDLLLVDIMLPGVDGFQICEEARQAIPHQAICLLTARGAEADILHGFACGADDYVTKPFSVQQLLARVAALVRRACPAEGEVLACGDWRVEVDALCARRGARQVLLSRRDVAVLRCLARHRPAVVERACLLQEVWGYGRLGGVETRCVDMHVVKLRRKLDGGLGVGAGAGIETVRGAGYRLLPAAAA